MDSAEGGASKKFHEGGHIRVGPGEGVVCTRSARFLSRGMREREAWSSRLVGALGCGRDKAGWVNWRLIMDSQAPGRELDLLWGLLSYGRSLSREWLV